MSYYDHYVSRPRNQLGVRAKLRQARRIFELGVSRGRNGPLTVLEIGPGDGYIAELALADRHEYFAIEASESIATSLRERGFRVHQAFVPPLPPEPHTIDACFALHVIEHMQNMQAATEFICAIRDRLKPGGSIVVATPDFSRWKTHFYDSDYTHVLPFTARRLRQLLLAADLSIEFESLYVGPLFGYVGVPFAWLASLFFTPTVDDIFRRLLPRDIASRGFLTILPNLIVVAKRNARNNATI
jgi:SAM-dependent methyltransferase